MLRLIVRTDDAGMAANVGGNVLTTYRTFEIEAPELETFLKDAGNGYSQRQLVGAEQIKDRPHERRERT